MDSEEWYGKRDNRTDRSISGLPYATFHPTIILPSIEDGHNSIAIEVLLGILPRFCRKVTLVPPSGDTGTRERLRDEFIPIMNEIDPYGCYQLMDSADIGLTEAPTVALGRDFRVDVDAQIVPDGWGCRVCVDKIGDFQTQDENPVGSIIAGCVAAREVFLRFIGSKTSQSFSFAPFDTEVETAPEWTSEWDLGKCLAVGAGGVGSNLIYFLSKIGVKSDITSVDFDRVDFSNLNRCIPFYYSDVQDQAYKVESLASRFNSSRMTITPITMEYSDYIKEYGREEFDMCFALANEKNVLTTMQNNLPPLSWCAGMSQNWGISISRHIPMMDSCLACRESFHPLDMPQMVCSEGVIRKEEKDIVGSIPFLAPLTAAILAARSIVLTKDVKISSNNLIQVDAGSKTMRPLNITLSSKPRCLCSSIPKEVYNGLISDSKYAYLSLPF